MESLHVGIDLGTVNSCMAVCVNGKSEIFTCHNSQITPSFVGYDPNIGNACVGESAQNDIENYKNVIYDAKRFIGRPFNNWTVQNIYKNYPFKVKSGEEGATVFEIYQNGKPMDKSPVEVSTEILSYFKQCLDMKYPDVENYQVVISIPAYFTAPQREATMDAIAKAGFMFYYIVNEPAAAAFNVYNTEEQVKGCTLVFDLGGGTFDIAVVCGDSRVVKMECYDGDNFLGGRNFEEEMFKYFDASYRQKGIILNSGQISRLQKCLKRMKEMLSKREKAKVDLEDFLQDGADEEISLTRSIFEEINSKLFQKCIDIVERCLSQNKIKKADIKNVVMVGGSTKIPKIQELVKSFFGEGCKYYSVDPDLSVALGAAYYAVQIDDKLNAAIMPWEDFKKLKLQDVVPMDVGIRIRFGLFKPIIKRNSPIPIKGVNSFYLYPSKNVHSSTYIFEGNWHCAAQNNFLGKIKHENMLIRHRFGCYDEISGNGSRKVRHCNWVRFVRVATAFNPSVNFVATKVRGEPVYEAVKPIPPDTELLVYYLPERPEELFFVRMRASLYRQTMDSILEDSPLDLSMSLLSRALSGSPPSAEDERKSVSGDSSAASSQGDIPEQTVPTPRARPRERTLLPCGVCSKAFDRPSLLKRHMRTHTGEKPHVCMVCGKGFSTSSSLNTHRRIHSGEKPHQCPVCLKRFTASSNLYYHRMTHIKDKPHKCNLCSKSFPTPGDLRSHMYVHSGSWPFKCHICSRGFSKHTNLKNHLFLHTGKPNGTRKG